MQSSVPITPSNIAASIPWTDNHRCSCRHGGKRRSHFHDAFCLMYYDVLLTWISSAFGMISVNIEVSEHAADLWRSSLLSFVAAAMLLSSARKPWWMWTNTQWKKKLGISRSSIGHRTSKESESEHATTKPKKRKKKNSGYRSHYSRRTIQFPTFIIHTYVLS